MSRAQYSVSSSSGGPKGRPYVVLDNSTRPGKIVEAHRTPAAAQRGADKLNHRCTICRHINGDHAPTCAGYGGGAIYYGEPDPEESE